MQLNTATATATLRDIHRSALLDRNSRQPTAVSLMEDDLEMSSGSGPGPSRSAAARKELTASSNSLLGNALFPDFQPENSVPSNIEQLQEADPLAAQVWKFFTKTKQQLPNQQRMENLTWRMMALSMRKRSQDEQA